MQVVDFKSKKIEKLRKDVLTISSIDFGGGVVDTKAIFEKIDPKYKVKKEYIGKVEDFLIVDDEYINEMLFEVFEFFEPKKCSWIKYMG